MLVINSFSLYGMQSQSLLVDYETAQSPQSLNTTPLIDAETIAHEEHVSSLLDAQSVLPYTDTHAGNRATENDLIQLHHAHAQRLMGNICTLPDPVISEERDVIINPPVSDVSVTMPLDVQPDQSLTSSLWDKFTNWWRKSPIDNTRIAAGGAVLAAGAGVAAAAYGLYKACDACTLDNNDTESVASDASEQNEKLKEKEDQSLEEVKIAQRTKTDDDVRPVGEKMHEKHPVTAFVGSFCQWVKESFALKHAVIGRYASEKVKTAQKGTEPIKNKAARY